MMGVGTAEAPATGGVFLVWRAYQGRVDSMQSHFGYETFYLGWAFRLRLLRPLEYAVKAVQTLAILLRERPAVVWLQVPPTPLLYTVALFKEIGPRTFAIADCHNGIIGGWARSPFLVRLLNSSMDVMLVHTPYVRREVLKLGVHEDRCLLLETPGRLPPPADRPAIEANGFSRPWALFPAGFDPDEPIREVLEAAARLPEVTFVVTGNTSRARGRHELSGAPANVVFTGWLDVPAYKRLLSEADLVIGLTTREGVAVNAASEAVGAGQAMVLSDTEVLRHLFPRGAVYVGPEAGSIAAGVRQALSRREELQAEVRECRSEGLSRWRSQAAAVQRRLPSLFQLA